MPDDVSLFHGTSYESLEKIDQQGLKTPSSRGEAPDIGGDLVKHQVVYLYDPDEISEWILEDFDDVFVQVSLPGDEVYVTRYGYEPVEKMTVDEMMDRCHTYDEFLNDETDFGENDSVMFLYPDDISRDRINALKWTI